MKVWDYVATVDAIMEKKEERGWSDSRFAKILGITPQAVCKWRKGTAAPSLENLFRMTSLFEVSLLDITKGMEVEDDFDLSD